MKVLVVYESKFGNTERLARAIAGALEATETVTVIEASVASARDLAGVELLAVGGPTQVHGVSPGLHAFLDRVPDTAVRDLPTIAFDTRAQGPKLLTGSAAVGCARRLEKKGAWLVRPAESFLVVAKEGPLLEGELERAKIWAATIRNATHHPIMEKATAPL